MEAKKLTKPLGRPRKFDKEIALEKAMQVFRRKGYEATSITDITKELGINRPSVYSAFGNKEELFAKALVKYIEGPIAYLNEALSEKTSREVVRKMLMQSVDLLTSLDSTKGCLVIQSSVSSELEAVGIQQKIVESLNQHEEDLKERFKLAIKEGDLPETCNAGLLAKYVTTVHKGLSIQAANGANRETLYGVVEIVIEGWPGR